MSGTPWGDDISLGSIGSNNSDEPEEDLNIDEEGEIGLIGQIKFDRDDPIDMLTLTGLNCSRRSSVVSLGQESCPLSYYLNGVNNSPGGVIGYVGEDHYVVPLHV